MTHFAASVISNSRVSSRYFELNFSWHALPPTPGQFITLRLSDGPVPLLRRPFAVSAFEDSPTAARGAKDTGAVHGEAAGESPPASTAAIIYEERGRGTRLLQAAGPGDSLDVLGPLGVPFPAPKTSGTPVLIAGGAGLGPLLFLYTALTRGRGRPAGRLPEQHGESPPAPGAAPPAPADARPAPDTVEAPDAAGAAPPAPAVAPLFVFGARDASAVPPWLEDRGALIATEDGSLGARGTALDVLLDRLPSLRDPELFVCGPHPMLKAVAGLASEHGLRCWVSMEQTMGCAVGACLGCVVPLASADAETSYARVCTEGPVFDSRSIRWE